MTTTGTTLAFEPSRHYRTIGGKRRLVKHHSRRLGDSMTATKFPNEQRIEILVSGLKKDVKSTVRKIKKVLREQNKKTSTEFDYRCWGDL